MSLVKNRIVHSPYPPLDIPECTLYDFIAEKLVEHAEKTAYIEGTETTSFAELLKLVRQFATGFQKNGVCRGDRVIVALNNTTDGLVAILSLMFSGCVLCFSSGPRTKQELVYHAKDAGVAYCLVDAYQLPMFVQHQEECNFKKIFVTRDTMGFVAITTFRRLPEMALEALRETDTKKALCAIAFMSGTTGDPKGVMLSQYSFVAGIQGLLAIKCVSEDDVCLNLWRLFSVSSVRVFLTMLCAGCTAVMVKPDSGSPKLMEQIRRHNVTAVCASATPMSALATDAYSMGEKLPTVRRTCSIGGTLLPSVLEKMRDVYQLLAVTHIYGMTEAAGCVLVPPIDALSLPFLGFAGPGVLIKVVDVDTKQLLPEGKNGHICCKIPSVMLGFLNKPEETREVLDPEGWLFTGDFGYYDAEGRVHYIDRLSDLVKCIGFHVPTAELEQVLLTVPEVGEAAVVGVPSVQYQDAPVAFIVTKPGMAASASLAERIKKRVEESCPKHMQLYGGVAFVEKLPKNDMGKVLKRELRKLALDPKTQKL
ncbi:uncharacterized protein [Dermacentor albipictus]|uniref:uncharacterized protein n=1 Tax=Dermacentor albipictus TaxID=60249 RepID=UPI0038FD1B18